MEGKEKNKGCLQIIGIIIASVSVIVLIGVIFEGVGKLLMDLGYIGSTLFGIGIIIAVMYAIQYFEK